MGFPTMVEWLDPSQVQIVDQALQGRGSFWDPIYYWRGRQISPEQLVHIPWYTVPFKVKGLSPMGAFASAVDIGLDGQKYLRDWYRNGGIPPGTFKNSEEQVTDPEAKEIRGRLTESIRTHETLVFGRDWEYKPITINPSDAIFVETHQLSANDVATVYGIYPPERIGGTTSKPMTYSNVEAEQIQWANITLQPYAGKLESHFFDLLPDPQYVKFMLDASIRTDTKGRHEIHQIDREIGLKNIDEIRAMEDLPPLPNGEGQSYTPLIAVRETIRAAAITTVNPNEPGFQAGEPIPPGAAGQPGAAPVGTPSAAGAGRFVGQPGELAVVGANVTAPSSNGRSYHGEEEDGGLPPF
jgi:HK97 family phage portal protein